MSNPNISNTRVSLSLMYLFFIVLQTHHRTNAQSRFQNDICIPSTLYMLEGVQNDIFVEPMIKRWRPYDDVVRFSGTRNTPENFSG